jgi:hypothetical protein
MTNEELLKRLRELRSNQYADPNTAPEFVFLDPDLPPSEWEKQYSMDVVYVRADRIEALTVKLAQATWLLTEAAVQLEEGKIKTRRNRAAIIWNLLDEMKADDAP